MSGTLPNWIARLLGIHTAQGEGTAWCIELTWPWPPWVTLLFMVFAVVFVVAIYLREGRQASTPYRMLPAAVRLALVAVVMMMIAQTSISLQRTGLPYVAVLIDDSLSMTVVDRYEGKLRKVISKRVEKTLGADAELNRWNLARTLLLERDAAMLSAMDAGYKLRVYFLTGVRVSGQTDAAAAAEEIRRIEPTGQSTRLGDAVCTVLDQLRGRRPAAMVLLTDGINTAGRSLRQAAQRASGRGVPLFTVALGSNRTVQDLKLTDLLVEQFVFVDDLLQFECKLTGTGFHDKKVGVVLRQEDEPQVLSKVDVTVGPDGQTQQLRVPYRPTEVGRFRFTIEVEPQQGELNTENNSRQCTVEVRKEKIRVLLVQAYPSFEFRYLENMFRRDETVELNTVLQEADVEHAEQDSAALSGFPVRRDDLFAYDVVIFGDVNPAMLSDSMLQNLAEFVDRQGRGGAMVFVAGPEYTPAAFRNTPLARLLPIEPGEVRYPNPEQVLSNGFRVQPTELGFGFPPMQLGDTPAETREIWSNLPKLYWLMEVNRLKPSARVLAVCSDRLGRDGNPLPVICLQYVGSGKVLLHATDETWRWRRRVGDVYFARYWIQMIRYLSRSKLAPDEHAAVLTADKHEYDQGEAVRLRVRFDDERTAPAEDDGVTVVLEHQGGKTRRIRLHRVAGARGIFQSKLGRLPSGRYHAWIAVPATGGRDQGVDFTVAPPAGEFERVRTDVTALRRAAKQTKGRFYTFSSAARLPRNLPYGRQVPIESLPSVPLWNKYPVLLCCLVLLIVEWILRKRGGMV